MLIVDNEQIGEEHHIYWPFNPTRSFVMVNLVDRGLFWKDNEIVPPNSFAPDVAVWGELTIEDNGFANLDLDGVISSNGSPLAAMLHEHPDLPEIKAIRGKLKNTGKFIYLTKIFKSGGQFRSDGISFEKWSANICLVSDTAFPAHPWEPRSPTLSVELLGYEKWLNLGEIHLKAESGDDRDINVSYKLPNNIYFDGDGGRLSLQYNIYRPRWEKSFHQLEMHQTATIGFEKSDGLSVEEIIHEHSVISDLLVLLTDCERNLYWPEIVVEAHVCLMYFARIKIDAKAPSEEDFWVPFSSIRDSFGEVYFNWRELRSTVGPGVYLYLGTRRGLSMYFEHTYVNLIWGMEAFHRAKFPTREIAPALQSKIDRIVAGLQPRDRRWLEGILHYATTPSLKERLFDLLTSLPIDLDRSAVDHFTAECARKRNAISHLGWGGADVDRVEFRNDMNNRIEALSYLYHALLLSAIGINSAQVRSCFSNSFRSFHIRAALERFSLCVENPSEGMPV